MSDYIHLTGAEDVRTAGSQIRNAADEFSRGIYNLDEILSRHLRQFESLVERFETMQRCARPVLTGEQGSRESGGRDQTKIL